jgi:mRNA interferase RelE/StbE
MNAIEWSAKAVRQLRKIADKRKRQNIYAEAQQLAGWPDCR